MNSTELPKAWLEILEGPDAIFEGKRVGKLVPLSKSRIIVGRNPNRVDLQLYNLEEVSTVSRVHCVIEYDASIQSFMITDEDSTVGTFISNILLQAHEAVELQNGDLIELGTAKNGGVLLKFGLETQKQPKLNSRMLVRSPLRPERTKQFDRESLTTNKSGNGVSSGADIMSTRPVYTSPNKVTYIFLSYSHEDLTEMHIVSNFLSEYGFDAWTDERIKPGSESWKMVVTDKIETSRCVVVILSPNSKRSEWVERELDYAKVHNKPVIPILMTGTQTNAVPISLINSQLIDVREPRRSEGLHELVEILEANLTFDIYIVHHAKDLDLMRVVHSTLTASLDVWFDERLPTDAEDWKKKIDNARCAIVVVSQDSLRSERIKNEMNYIKQQGKPTIYVSKVPLKPLDNPSKQYIDMSKANQPLGLKLLVEAVYNALNS